MQLKEIMSKDVELLDADATLNEAARKMKDRNIGSIPVRKGDRLAGLITDRDIVVRGLAMGADPMTEKVSNIMTSPIVYCFEDQTIEEAAQVMEEKGIRRLPVLSREKRLTGFVSLHDVACDGKDEKLTGRILQSVSQAAVH